MSDPVADLAVAYDDFTAIARALDEPSSWLPTECPGWAVRDLLFHLLTDAQRALVALATPTAEPPDRDAVSYWRPSSHAVDPDARELRAVRTMAATFGRQALVGLWAETAAAATSAARQADPERVVRTQGVHLRVADLVTTLVVEAAIHHLDLPPAVAAGGPAAGPLRLARRTVDGLRGVPTPVDWDDAGWVRTASGRRAPTPAERAVLGAEVGRLPLLR